MNIRQTLSFLSALAALSAVSACTTHHARHDDSYSVTTGEWDSGPLDRDYQRERRAMEARHAEEAAQTRADEDAQRRDSRQAAERQQLEDRYRRGKDGHMKKLPPADHDTNGDRH